MGENRLIGVYDYTVIATILSAVLAVLGISCAGDNNPFGAITCLMLCGLLDSFDGLIASTKKNRTKYQKRYGIQLDSLCDIISFGVLPCFVGMSCGMKSYWFFLIFAVYIFGAVSRLAHFNVTEEERQDETDERRKYYSGMPVTLSSVIIPVVCLLRYFVGDIFVWIIAVAILVCGVLFVTPIKLKKPTVSQSVAIVILGIGIFIVHIALRFFYGM